MSYKHSLVQIGFFILLTVFILNFTSRMDRNLMESSYFLDVHSVFCVSNPSNDRRILLDFLDLRSYIISLHCCIRCTLFIVAAKQSILCQDHSQSSPESMCHPNGCVKDVPTGVIQLSVICKGVSLIRPLHC